MLQQSCGGTSANPPITFSEHVTRTEVEQDCKQHWKNKAPIDESTSTHFRLSTEKELKHNMPEIVKVDVVDVWLAVGGEEVHAFYGQHGRWRSAGWLCIMRWCGRWMRGSKWERSHLFWTSFDRTSLQRKRLLACNLRNHYIQGSWDSTISVGLVYLTEETELEYASSDNQRISRIVSVN